MVATHNGHVTTNVVATHNGHITTNVVTAWLEIMNMQNLELSSTADTSRYKTPARLKRTLESLASALPRDTAFEVELRGELMRIGRGRVRFRVAVHNRRGVSALSSLDEKRIGEAYLDG